MKFRLRAWTGPTYIKEIAQACREAGIEDVIEGTEHVVVREEGGDKYGACWNALVTLRRKHGKDFGLHFEPFSRS